MKKMLTRIRVRIISLLLMTALMVVSCCGCWSRVEIEKVSFISVVGVDRAGRDLLVSFQIVNPRALAKNGGAGGGGGGEPPVFVLSVTGRTLSDAMAKISQESPRVAHFKQLDAIVLGEDLGRMGVSRVVDYFARHHEMRRSIWVTVAKGSAQEVLLKGAPVQESVPGMAIKMLMERRERLAPTHYPVKLGDFLNGMSLEGTDAIASAVNVRPMQEKKLGGGVKEEDGNVIKVAAEKKEIVFEGAGVFRGDKLQAYLGPHEARGVLWFLGKIQGGVYTVPNPSQGTWATLTTEKASVRVKPIITKDNISFKVNVYDESFV